MQFRLTLNCDNDAFAFEKQDYIARLLRDVADRLEEGDSCNTWCDIRDVDGNTVGQFALKPREQF